MIQRAVNVKAKVSLRSSTIVQDLDAHYPRSYRSFYTTLVKIQTQRFNFKKSKSKESRPKKSKLAKNKIFTPPRSKLVEHEKISCIDKNREYLKKKQERKNNIPAMRDNDNAIEDSEKKRNNQGDKWYYNCQKRAIFQKTT